MSWPVTVTPYLVLSSYFQFSSASFYSIPLKIVKSEALSTFRQEIPNQECASDLISLVSDASNFKLWALKMLDASGKMNSSLFDSNFHHMGDYDQCLSISEEVDGRTIDGQYCTLFVSIKHEEMGHVNSSSYLKNVFKLLFPDWDTTNLETQEIRKFPERFRRSRALPDIPVNRALMLLGLCVPKSCSAENLENLGRHIENKYMWPVQITVPEEACLYKGKPVEITKLDIFVYCFFTVIFLAIVSSTIYDLNLRQSRNRQDSNWRVSFSAYTNLKNLFKETKNNVPCIDGMKVLISWWALVGHLGVMMIFLLQNPSETLSKVRNSAWGLFVLGGFYSMTGFFTISGFLVSYRYLRQPEPKSDSLLSFYGKRFLRVTPPLLAVDFIQASVLKFLPEGPFGDIIVNVATNICQTNWWQDLFMFFNRPSFEGCQQHAWSTVMDGQLYLLTPLILFFIRKHPRTVLTGTTLAIFAGIAYSSLITINKRMGISIIGWNTDFLDYLYLSTLYRLPAWLIGMMLGYLLYEGKIKISRRLNLVLWTISVCTTYKLVFGQVAFFTGEYSVYRTALWNGLSNPLGSLCLCFYIFSCATGNAGFLNTFLSHSVFRVLSKLLYCIYLTQMSVMYIYFGNMKETYNYSVFRVFTDFIQIFLITLPSSLLLYLSFEAPIAALRYHVEKHWKSRKDEIKDS